MQPGEKVREMHPEVAFWALNKKTVLTYKKKDPAGADERLAILSRWYPAAEECFYWAREQYLVKEVATDDILDAMAAAEECFYWAREQYLVKEVATDDILDAMVGAVTAMQFPHLSTLPVMPMLDEERLPMEIVYYSDS
jgi:predicted RNase H-like nuclease